MKSFKEDAEKLFELLGGKENVAAVTHCMTRMRYVLQEPDKVDTKAIEALPSVKGTFTQAGQFQVIIGNDVADFYNEFVKISGIEGVTKDTVKSMAKQNQNPLQRAISVLAEIFAPLLPAIMVGGLILGFRNCIDSLYLFENGTKTLCDISQFWTGVDQFLWLIGEAVFHMLPVGICWSVTKKMGTTQILGIVLGLTLVSGQLLNAYAVATTPAFEIPVWDFGAFTINMIGYQAQVIPAILAAFMLVFLERFFKKITPKVLSMIVVPFCSLLLAVIAAHFILGPIGWQIGALISKVVYSGITGSFKAVFGAIFGFVYAPLVITGLHHMTNAIDLQLVADYGGTMLWPMIALSNIAQSSAVLAMIVLQRKNSKAQEVNISSCISGYLSITEPAMFGVNLKYVFPFFSAMIGSACAGAVSILTKTTANSIGVGGLPAILSIQPQSMVTFLLCMVIAIAVPFTLTFTLGKKKGVDKDKQDTDVSGEDTGSDSQAADTSVSEVALKAFADGELIPLSEVNDGVFSEKVMGDGIAIIPNSNMLYAPADGVIVTLMEDSRHACGLTLDNGTEVLLHIGIDTVKMQGEGFRYLVKEGDHVQSGTPLVEFDRNKIKQAGLRDVIVCVITSEDAAMKIVADRGSAQANTTNVIILEEGRVKN